MVRIHTPEMDANRNPVMRPHDLTAVKKTKTFKSGEKAECYITRMSDGRYQVFDASGAKLTKHHEVFTEKELHESFTES